MWEKGGVTATAKRIGVARSTVYTWLEAEEIPQRHVAALSRVLGLARGELRKGAA